jgi:hypothetical protein
MSKDDLFAYVLECNRQNPPTHFVLDYSRSQEIRIDLQTWRTGNWPLTVLCNGCFEPYERSEQDIQKVFSST